MSAEKCEEIERRVEELQAKMLTKNDIPAIATQTREQMELVIAAQFGRKAFSVLVSMFGLLGAGAWYWLAAHGYIRAPGP